MTSHSRAFVVAMMLAPLAFSPGAAQGQEETTQEQMTDVTAMTCAEYLEQDGEGREATMEALAAETGMDAEGAEEVVNEARLADMITFCEVSPDLQAMEAFQNAMDNPG